MISVHSRIIALGLLVASVGCVSRSEHQKTLDDLDSTRNELQQLEATAQEYMQRVSGLEAERDRLASENQSLRGTATDASARWSTAQAQIDALNQQLADAKKNMIPGVDIDTLNGAVRYSMKDSVLFDSGKSEVKASGKKTLGDLAKVLKQSNYRIEVAGHTDTDPVTKTKNIYKLGNIELGVERALSVWKVLVDEGVPAARMHVSSYGEYRPYKEGDAKNKAQNRRVEVLVSSASGG